MKLELISKKELPLLSRTRASFMAEYKGVTPTRKTFRKLVAAQLGTSEELTIIRHIYTKFGFQNAKIIAHIYKNVESMKRIEDKNMLKKHLINKEANKEMAESEGEKPSSDAKTSETPAAEKKEGSAAMPAEGAKTAKAE